MKSKHGFTLIESLTALSVLGVLIVNTSSLLGTFTRQRAAIVRQDQAAAQAESVAQNVRAHLTDYYWVDDSTTSLTPTAAQFAWNGAEQVLMSDPRAKLMPGRVAYRVVKTSPETPRTLRIEVLVSHPQIRGGQKTFQFLGSVQE